jgi:nicotinate-nucleotide--dimethylbenzimidazole phosphoribosyltransferase
MAAKALSVQNTSGPNADLLSGLPFADLFGLLNKVSDFNQLQADLAIEYQQSLVQPWQERGRLYDIAVWLAGWQGRVPSVRRPELCLFAGASALADQQAQNRAQAAAKMQIVMLSSGGSAANSLAAGLSAGLRVFDLAVDQPGGRADETAAMSERGCARAFAFGMEAVASNADLLCLAGFGPGSRQAAAVTAMLLLDGAAADWCEEADQQAFFAAAHALHGPASTDAFELLRRCGSREMAAICGAIVAARTQSIPVIFDGFVAAVAALLLHRARPGMADHCLLSGRDGSRAHDAVILALAQAPMLDLKITATDGLGALLAAHIVRAAADLHNILPKSANIDGVMAQAGASS